MKKMPTLYSFGSEGEIDDPSSVTVVPTSSHSGDVPPIDLRQPTDLTRLRFAPKVVMGEDGSDVMVEGAFLYERKGPKDDYFPLDAGSDFISKRNVRKGDALKLVLNSSETKALYDGLSKLYRAADGMEGIPYGTSTYVAVDRTAKTLLELLKEDPSTVRMIADEDMLSLVRELLRLLTQGASKDDLREVLVGMEDNSLQSLSSSFSVERLNRVREEFAANINNSKESYWQAFFEKNAWVISQVLCVPCALYESQAYAGGKSLGNKGGNLPDFLYQNRLTKNVAIVEIKTPRTSLLGEPYRSNSYSMSKELSGAVAQVQSYRQALLNEFNNLYMNSGGGFEVFSPLCVIVLGSTSELSDRAKSGSFENFRGCLSGVVVLTYDELLGKIDDLINLFSKPNQENAVAYSDTSQDLSDIPF